MRNETDAILEESHVTDEGDKAEDATKRCGQALNGRESHRILASQVGLHGKSLAIKYPGGPYRIGETDA